MFWFSRLLTGIYFTLFIYHLFFYLGRRNDKSNLYYSLLNLSLVLTVFIKRIYPYTPLYNAYLEPVFIVFILLMTIGSYLYFFCYFMVATKAVRILKIFYYLLLGVSAVGSVLYLITGRKLLFLNSVHVVAILYGLVAYILVLRIVTKDKKELTWMQKKVIIASLITLIPLIIAGIIIILGFLPPVWLMATFTLFYNFDFAYLLVNKFNKEHYDLIELKKTLERRIIERTEQLTMEKEHKAIFFINCAHEIKTPLTLIGNYLDKSINESGTDHDLERIKLNVETLQYDVINFLETEKKDLCLDAYEQKETLFRNLSDSIYDPQKPNLLFVDGNTGFLSLLKIHTRDEYNFYYALNSEEALAKLSRIPEPDLIISDMMNEGLDTMDGLAFYNELLKQKEYRNIPVIFLSEQAGKAEKLKALTLGALDYIPKPFSTSDLLQKIRVLVKNFQGQKHNQLDEFKTQFLDIIDANTRKSRAAGTWNARLTQRCTVCGLTDKERAVAFLLAKGFINKEIASRLDISDKTVAVHVQHIYEKFNVTNRSGFMSMILEQKSIGL